MSGGDVDVQNEPQLPGVRFTVQRPPPPTEPLRSDVGGFVGRARRGPGQVAVRVEGWQEQLAQFGGIDGHGVLPYALRGYFENGGQIAHVVRLLGAGAELARGTWLIGSPVPAGFSHDAYTVEATSAGSWANGTTVQARYWDSPGEGPRLDLEIRCAGEPLELLASLDVARLAEQVGARSRLVRVQPAPGANPAATPPGTGPRQRRWDPITLRDGAAGADPDLDAYMRALDTLAEQPEVALLAAPDLFTDLDEADGRTWLARAATDARARLDRLLIADFRAGFDAAAQLEPLRRDGRAAAMYGPDVLVADPVADAPRRLRAVPPSGHVAGVISRLDRERGAHHTPANATLAGVYDVACSSTEREQARLYRLGINPLRCQRGRGVMLWGGRTVIQPEQEPEHLFVAHRRLVHRLVRGFRRVAEPLVFETNGPVLWLAVARAMTTLLVEVWRGGGLRGERAEEAFFVHCDGKTNTPESIEAGVCLCEVGVAPAAPMEFITLRIALRRDGTLEVQ